MWSQPKRDNKYVQTTKLMGAGSEKLTSDVEMQSLGLTLLVLGLVLVEHFLTTLPFLPFGLVMYILCRCMLEACGLLSDF